MAKGKLKYNWKPQGEANNYVITKDDNWFMIIQVNGELHFREQESLMTFLIQNLNEVNR